MRPSRDLNRLSEDQIIEVFLSTEPDPKIAKRLGVSLAQVIAIRGRYLFTTVTSGLPDRPRGRGVNRPVEVIETERRERRERVRKRAERNATILSSREPGFIIARQLGITRTEVSRVRRAGGWLPPPKPPKPPKPRRAKPPKPAKPIKLKPLRPPKPPKPKVPKLPKPAMPAKPQKLKPLKPPKPKPAKPEPRESKWEPALALMSRSWQPPLPPPPAPKVNVRAELRRFIAKHPVLSVLALSARLDLRLPWLSIIQAMPRPTGPAGPLGPREHKQVGPAVRIKPGYLKTHNPRSIVCRVYAVGDRPPATGLGEPI